MIIPLTRNHKLIGNSEIKRWFDEIYLAYFYKPAEELNFEIYNGKTLELITP
jgi:hypothetical protein